MKRRMGRECIELLKTAYRDGQAFPNRYAIRDYLADKTGAKTTRLNIYTVTDWDRQARLENADAGYANTFPGAPVNYERNPMADQLTRQESHTTSLRYSATRVANEVRLAKANAAQPDATRIEIERAARVEVAAAVLKYVAEANNGDGDGGVLV